MLEGLIERRPSIQRSEPFTSTIPQKPLDASHHFSKRHESGTPWAMSSPGTRFTVGFRYLLYTSSGVSRRRWFCGLFRRGWRGHRVHGFDHDVHGGNV
jgi:hypothetical protein